MREEGGGRREEGGGRRRGEGGGCREEGGEGGGLDCQPGVVAWIVKGAENVGRGRFERRILQRRMKSQHHL
jgi:hypothetical protein